MRYLVYRDRDTWSEKRLYLRKLSASTIVALEAMLDATKGVICAEIMLRDAEGHTLAALSVEISEPND